MTLDVVIAGGGPNGLLLACELKLAGVHPVVLERLPEPSTEAKANGLVGRVVQALDYRGLATRFTGGGPLPAPTPGYQFGGLMLDLSTVGEHALRTLPVPQPRMEEILAQRAAELGVELRRGHELTALAQDADGVTLDVRGPDGDYQVRAGYLVGCDGRTSAVRKLAGIGFPGSTNDRFVSRIGRNILMPQAMLVPETGELDVPGLGRLAQFTFHRTANGVFVFGSFAPGVYLTSVIEWDQPPIADTVPITLDELHASVRRVLGADVPISPLPAGGEPELARLSGSNSRQADRYRAGRVLLAGDAAHVHSGVGGAGLNLGMQDVLNLGWKLAAQLRGWAPAGLLDSYQAERHPVGARVLMHTKVQMLLLGPGTEVTALRDLFTELLDDPSNRLRIADLLAGADVRYDMLTTAQHPMIGRWMPDVPLRGASGVSTVAELLHPARPVLLLLKDRPELAGVAEGWKDRVDVVSAAADLDVDAVLIRPDGYVAWANGSDDSLREALVTWFGAPG